MSVFDPKFKYTKSEEMKPGYLAEKFKKLQREIEAKKKANAQEIEAKVRRLA